MPRPRCSIVPVILHAGRLQFPDETGENRAQRPVGIDRSNREELRDGLLGLPDAQRRQPLAFGMIVLPGVNDVQLHVDAELRHPFGDGRPLGRDLAAVGPRVHVRRALVEEDRLRTLAMLDQ